MSGLRYVVSSVGVDDEDVLVSSALGLSAEEVEVLVVGVNDLTSVGSVCLNFVHWNS